MLIKRGNECVQNFRHVVDLADSVEIGMAPNNPRHRNRTDPVDRLYQGSILIWDFEIIIANFNFFRTNRKNLLVDLERLENNIQGLMRPRSVWASEIVERTDFRNPLLAF